MATHTRLNQALVQARHPDERWEQWSERLREVGLLSWTPAQPNTPPQQWTPEQGIFAIQEALSALRVAEVSVTEAIEADPLASVKVPDAVWWIVGAALLGLILFANVLVETFGPNAIWVGLAFAAAVALYTVVDRRRRAAEFAARARLDEARNALTAALRDLLDRNFVAAVGGQLLVNTPDLDRLRALEEALALSDPDADILADIRAHIQQITTNLDAALAAPPARWTDTGLHAEVDAIQSAIDAL